MPLCYHHPTTTIAVNLCNCSKKILYKFKSRQERRKIWRNWNCGKKIVAEYSHWIGIFFKRIFLFFRFNECAHSNKVIEFKFNKMERKWSIQFCIRRWVYLFIYLLWINQICILIIHTHAHAFTWIFIKNAKQKKN